jgi:hypothetical protein
MTICSFRFEIAEKKVSQQYFAKIYNIWCTDTKKQRHKHRQKEIIVDTKTQKERLIDTNAQKERIIDTKTQKERIIDTKTHKQKERTLLLILFICKLGRK